MACTRDEFLTWLAAAIHPAILQGAHDGVTIVAYDGTIDVSATEQPPRIIGALTLPTLSVSFCFRGIDEHARRAFLERFDLHSRRGGG